MKVLILEMWRRWCAGPQVGWVEAAQVLCWSHACAEAWVDWCEVLIGAALRGAVLGLCMHCAAAAELYGDGDI